MRYSWPLIICDSNSRIILGIICHFKPDYKSVKSGYIRVFRDYGLPEFMHYKVIKAAINDAARWGAYNWLWISRAVVGRYVGAEEIGNGILECLL